MIRAHVYENQTNWDLMLKKKAFAYNLSVHLTKRITPYELKFGRKPTIPIDILIPNVELHQREAVIKEMVAMDDELGEITVLEDSDEEIFAKKISGKKNFCQK